MLCAIQIGQKVPPSPTLHEERQQRDQRDLDRHDLQREHRDEQQPRAAGSFIQAKP